MDLLRRSVLDPATINYANSRLQGDPMGRPLSFELEAGNLRATHRVAPTNRTSTSVSMTPTSADVIFQ